MIFPANKLLYRSTFKALFSGRASRGVARQVFFRQVFPGRIPPVLILNYKPQNKKIAYELNELNAKRLRISKKMSGTFISYVSQDSSLYRGFPHGSVSQDSPQQLYIAGLITLSGIPPRLCIAGYTTAVPYRKAHHIIGDLPMDASSSFALEKCLQPNHPLLAESGLG